MWIHWMIVQSQPQSRPQSQPQLQLQLQPQPQVQAQVMTMGLWNKMESHSHLAAAMMGHLSAKKTRQQASAMKSQRPVNRIN